MAVDSNEIGKRVESERNRSESQNENNEEATEWKSNKRKTKPERILIVRKKEQNGIANEIVMEISSEKKGEDKKMVDMTSRQMYRNKEKIKLNWVWLSEPSEFKKHS